MNHAGKLLITLWALIFLALSNASAKDGVASLPVFKGPFPETVNMRFLSQIDPEDLGALEVPGVWAKGMMNDIGGWTSHSGEEYALATNSGGIAIVRVTDPENPEYLGRVASQDPFDFSNIWGDPATFGNYAYFTTEIDGSGIVIIDMSGADALTATVDPFADLPLPSVTVAPGGYDGSHNIVINETTGYAYVAGAHLQAGAANNACGIDEPARFNTLILDLNANAMDPTVAACISDAGEHDFHVVNYTGPDAEHAGKEILFVFDGRDREGQAGGNPVGGKTLIWDVSDKNNIVELASFRIPGNVFSHNGATTEEQDFLFVGDEIEELVIANWTFSGFFTQPLDETTKKARTGTYVIDIRDLDNPIFVQRFENETVGIDHNFQVVGDKLYIASYTSGTRVLHIGRDSNDDVVLEEVGTMDTEPRLPGNIINIKQEERFGSAFLGQWGIFVFDTGTIIASDINNGLIVMEESATPCKGIKCSK
jgi:choice-of-anchor B domain-containing protein